MTRLCTKLKIQNFSMLDMLLEIKSTWYLTAAAQLLGRDGTPPICSVHIQKHPTMEEKLVAHDPSIGYVTRESRTPRQASETFIPPV